MLNNKLTSLSVMITDHVKRERWSRFWRWDLIMNFLALLIIFSVKLFVLSRTLTLQMVRLVQTALFSSVRLRCWTDLQHTPSTISCQSVAGCSDQCCYGTLGLSGIKEWLKWRCGWYNSRVSDDKLLKQFTWLFMRWRNYILLIFCWCNSSENDHVNRQTQRLSELFVQFSWQFTLNFN